MTLAGCYHRLDRKYLRWPILHRYSPETNGRFYNHSTNPNTEGIDLPETDGEGGDIATRDIQIYEEITCNYEKMDFEHKQKLL